MEHRYNSWGGNRNGKHASPNHSSFLKPKNEYNTGKAYYKSGKKLSDRVANTIPSNTTHTTRSNEFPDFNDEDSELERIWNEPLTTNDSRFSFKVRRTSSNLSWGDDEMEKELTKQVEDLWEDIEKLLYENEMSPSITPDLKNELDQWSKKFPHLRVNGIKSEIVKVSVDDLPDEDRKAFHTPEREEVIARHGNFQLCSEPDFGILSKPSLKSDESAHGSKCTRKNSFKFKEFLPNMWSDYDASSTPNLVINGDQLNHNHLLDSKKDSRESFRNNSCKKKYCKKGQNFNNSVSDIVYLFPKINIKCNETVNHNKAHKASEKKHSKHDLMRDKSVNRSSKYNNYFCWRDDYPPRQTERKCMDLTSSRLGNRLLPPILCTNHRSKSLPYSRAASAALSDYASKASSAQRLVTTAVGPKKYSANKNSFVMGQDSLYPCSQVGVWKANDLQNWNIPNPDSWDMSTNKNQSPRLRQLML